MERDDIVKMAREAGWPITDGSALIESLGALIDVATKNANERANASWASMCEKMVAAEREACAKVCDSEGVTDDERWAGQMFAREIRARGES